MKLKYALMEEAPAIRSSFDNQRIIDMHAELRYLLELNEKLTGKLVKAENALEDCRDQLEELIP